VRVCPALPVVLHGHRVLLLLQLRPLQPCQLLLPLQLRQLLLNLWLPHQLLLWLPLLPLQPPPSKDYAEDYLAWLVEPPGLQRVSVSRLLPLCLLNRQLLLYLSNRT
jgi:hypothetical protein